MTHLTRVLLKSTTTSTFVYLHIQVMPCLTPDVFTDPYLGEAVRIDSQPIPSSPAPPGTWASSIPFCPHTKRWKNVLRFPSTIFPLANVSRETKHQLLVSLYAGEERAGLQVPRATRDHSTRQLPITQLCLATSELGSNSDT